MNLRPFIRGLMAAVVFFGTSSAPGILFVSTGDPSHNTSPPTGSLTNSGWQYQGQWGGFLGTPVAPRFFLAAKHVGGTVGDIFRYRGVDYVTTGFFDDAGSDLRLWAVCGTLPEFAPIYMGSAEVGKAVVVFGRGTQRGAAVQGGLFAEEKGWRWGPSDGVQRWGSNAVTAVIDGDTVVPLPGGTVGTMLACTFDAGAGPDEAHLSGGDSSGGLFIQDGGVWKLAGINYAVDGPFNTSTVGAGFEAAIFDQGGLYTGGEGNWKQTPDLLVNVPSKFYATRVSDHAAWINGVLAGPLPADPAPVVWAATSVLGPFSPMAGATVDTGAATITVPVSSGPLFVRLRGCVALTIFDTRLDGTNLVMRYR
jgi:hypothetical protein